MTRPKTWTDPVKNHPPSEATLNTPGNFEDFTELMRKIVTKKEEPKKAPSSSRVPDVS